MAPADANLIIQDDFERNTLDENIWTTLDEVSVIDGRVRLGKPNAQEHINTLMSRPYLLTREPYAPAEGTLTILGTATRRQLPQRMQRLVRRDTRADNGTATAPVRSTRFSAAVWADF